MLHNITPWDVFGMLLCSAVFTIAFILVLGALILMSALWLDDRRLKKEHHRQVDFLVMDAEGIMRGSRNNGEGGISLK